MSFFQNRNQGNRPRYTTRVMKPYPIEKVKDDYGTHMSVSRFGPKTVTPMYSSTVVKSATPYVQQFNPLSSLGNKGEKPNLTGKSLSQVSFADSCSFKPAEMLRDPKKLNQVTAKSFASALGVPQAHCSDGVIIKSTSSTPTVIPRDLFKTLGKPIQRQLCRSSTTSDSSGSSTDDEEHHDVESKKAPVTAEAEAGENVASPTDKGDNLMQLHHEQVNSSPGNPPPQGQRPPLQGSQMINGHKANSFADAYSSEAWVYYAGLMSDHMAKMESFVRAKAENCEKTLLVKMAPGFTPTGTPEAFQMSISGSISLRRYWDYTSRSYTNLQPGKEFIVTPTAVPGIAEIWVPKESDRTWLIHQNRFSYHKLVIEKNGQVQNLGVKGSFFITSLRTPPQLYDILGAEFEHSDKYNEPLADLFKKVCPDALAIHVEEVTKPVPCLNPVTFEWVVKDVPGHKRVSITCPPESPFKIPDGPMVISLGETIGTRIVHTRRVLATTECQLCGERCWKDCKNRCSQCGLSGHIQVNCPNKQLGDIRKSSQWVESSVKTAMRIFSNPLYGDKDDFAQVMAERVGDSVIDDHVAEAQVKIMILANVPKETRDQVEEKTFDRSDLLSVAQDSSFLRNKSRGSNQAVRKRREETRRLEQEAAAVAEMANQLRDVTTVDGAPSIYDVPTQPPTPSSPLQTPADVSPVLPLPQTDESTTPEEVSTVVVQPQPPVLPPPQTDESTTLKEVSTVVTQPPPPEHQPATSPAPPDKADVHDTSEVAAADVVEEETSGKAAIPGKPVVDWGEHVEAVYMSSQTLTLVLPEDMDVTSSAKRTLETDSEADQGSKNKKERHASTSSSTRNSEEDPSTPSKEVSLTENEMDDFVAETIQKFQ
jgi:hypothetical protein